jgi:NodT family efflux transporter outer membrane factor (OMF) lipoprotein
MDKLADLVPARGLTVLLPLFLLAGCVVGPDYHAPKTAMPDAWQQKAVADLQPGSPSLESWWLRFQDPVLNQLVDKARAGNLDLKLTLLRVDEAKALRGVAQSEYYGSINVRGSALGTRVSKEGELVPQPGATELKGFYTLGADAAWEADLWGRVRRSVESANASLAATLEDVRDVYVTLLAVLADSYVQVRTLQRQIAFAEDNARLQRATLELARNRFAAGLVPELDVHRAELNLAITESSIPPLQTALRQFENALAVLIGGFPVELAPLLETAAPIPQPTAPVQVGVPAELLRQRPDIRRAERLIAAQNARIGVAASEWYPRFILVGDLHLEALGGQPFFNSAALAYAFGPQVRWNIFNGGRVRNQVRAEKIRTEQALNRYEQTVLLAVQETESAMVAYAQEIQRNQKLKQAVKAAERSVEQTQVLYKSGLTDFQILLDMERDLFQQQNFQAVSQGMITQDVIAIYRALGGGWDDGTLLPRTAAEADPAANSKP